MKATKRITFISVLLILFFNQARALDFSSKIENFLLGSSAAFTSLTDSSSNVDYINQYYSHCNSSLSISCPKRGIAIPDSLNLNCSTAEMGDFAFPFRGRILSPYGNKRRHHLHSGVDIKLQAGDSVKCAFNGVVRMAKRFHGYGLMVVVQHPNGLETLYAHLSKILVKVGEEVNAGYFIGLGGRTGRATTTHLHFETRFLGSHFDPAYLLNYQNFSIRPEALTVYYRHGELSFVPQGSLASQVESSGPKKQASATAANHKKKHTYTVRKGDTLYSIARKNSIPLDELCKKNKLKANDILAIGTKLKVN